MRAVLPDVIVMYTSVDGPTHPTHPAHAAPHTGRAETTAVQTPTPQPPAEDASWRLAHRPEAAGAARRIARSVLDGWGFGQDDKSEAVVLVVSELVTNAVQHAVSPLVLHLRREHADHRVWVGVSDGGPAPRERTRTASCAPEERGRGLGLVEALAVAHGTSTHDGGATHWARLPAAAWRRPQTPASS